MKKILCCFIEMEELYEIVVFNHAERRLFRVSWNSNSQAHKIGGGFFDEENDW